MRPILLAAALGLVLGPLGPGPARAEDGRLGVELNKLEDFEGGCRSFFLFRNRTDHGFSAFEMALAILDADGVIDRLLTIDASPLPTARTTLKIFEIAGLACDRIGEIVLHDMPACAADGGEALDCFALVDLGSRTGAALEK